MVTLPAPFTATKYNGYFWNTATQELYSLKMGGVLRKMKRSHPNRFNSAEQPYYGVYDSGRRRWLTLSYLNSLTLKDSEIPYKETHDYDYYFFGKVRDRWQPN